MTVRERLWSRATAGQRRAAAVGLASFVSRFYAKYDGGDRHRRLQDQMKWLWAAVSTGQAAGQPPVPRGTDEGRFVPDVDLDPSPAAAIGQVAALVVFAATAAVVGTDDEAADLWDLFDECHEHAAETEEDEAAYSEGLRALRGLSAEQVMAGLDALNKMPRKSPHARCVRAGFREAEAAVKAFLSQGGSAQDGAGHLRERLEAIDVPALLYRWKST